MKIYIKTIVFSILAVTVFSCSIDDIQPVNQLTTEDAIANEATAQLALNGVYDLGRAFDVNFFPLHLAAYGNEGRITGFLTGNRGFNTNEVPVENDFLSGVYNGHYKIINLSNFIIQELEAGKAIGISESRKNEILAQTKFQRAFAHFNLLRYFGEFYDVNSSNGIVVRTTFAAEIEANPRNSVQDVYNVIVSDLQFGIDNGAQFVDHFITGSLASKALLAKVYLYMNEYELAATLADQVINNSEGYSLELSYSDIFTNSFNSTEVIYAPFSGTGSEGGTNMNLINQTSYSTNLEAVADAQVGTATDGDLNGNGANYDPRFSFAYSTGTKGANQQGKYPFANFSTSRNNTMYHLRLGEMYLIHAEAEARRVGGDLTLALTSLNAIRSRATVTAKTLTDAPTLLEDIRQEKLLELFFENGESWFDVVRYDILGNIDATVIKPSIINNNQFVLPIPAQVIIGNSTVTQNPGY
ncbi:RagB/SusD family nutrient uptake outer membrane protein [Bizionia argentinensis JUB59]|uniref:RagB/SusD family nutrient uptake outer membrane protein n=1 Tax=Bizionia argentinensis JUB59 TaxID=1046627 RepID=G2EHM4_9FLAO|nr:RagB/SusD family nutrient uptake outer membrane protein [Bizionia argentinensis]EGV42061.1 RagB/SusD family nutrient uptake outer membrane protein [Bizionia argentinensis JUB59]